MKVVVFAILLFLLACSSAPKLIRVKNCRDIGAGLYDCEELSAREAAKANK